VTGHCVGCGDGSCNGAETCGTCAADCPCQGGQVCAGSSCCTKQCSGKTCGDDGCGNPVGCGSCQSGQSCQAGTCKANVSCGDGVCTAGSENCATCPSDCLVPTGQRCCADGTIHNCCDDDQCPSDPSTCLTQICFNGSCKPILCPTGSACCCDGACSPCGGGGFGGFQNLACAQ
jgi:hypothetical protein